MGIEITVRSTSSKSYFKDNLKRLIETPDTNTLLLSSGFFQDSIVLEDLNQWINSNCTKVILIGAKADYLNVTDKSYNYYKQFVTELNFNTIPMVEVQTYAITKWHGKVALKLKDTIPVVGLMGSSNLTLPAFSDNTTDFNFETDILIWASEVNQHFVPAVTDLGNDSFTPIYAELNKEVNQNDEKQRLAELYDLIMRTPNLKLKNVLTIEENCIVECIRNLHQNPDFETTFKDCGIAIDKLIKSGKIPDKAKKYIDVHFVDYYLKELHNVTSVDQEKIQKAERILKSMKKHL
jgi:hypothetical protein